MRSVAAHDLPPLTDRGEAHGFLSVAILSSDTHLPSATTTNSPPHPPIDQIRTASITVI